MAILKYTTSDGQTVKINSYKVNNLVPQQEKGDNPNAVMSQKAVTDEVNEIGLQIDEVTGQITTINTTLGTKANQSALDALTSTVNAKANANNVYTKAEADGKYLTANDITGKAEKSALESEVTRATTKEGELTTAIGTKAASADLTAEISRAQSAEQTNATAISDEVTRATSAEEELADRVDALEEIRVISCGEY